MFLLLKIKYDVQVADNSFDEHMNNLSLQNL